MPRIDRAWPLLVIFCLGACGTVATVGVIAVEATATVVGIAVDGAVLAGKGVVMGGELAVDAVRDDPKPGH